MPLLPVDKNNKYSCLEVEVMSEMDEQENICEDTPEEGVRVKKGKKVKKAAWER
jgi:hypothetical protein